MDFGVTLRLVKYWVFSNKELTLVPRCYVSSQGTWSFLGHFHSKDSLAEKSDFIWLNSRYWESRL